MAYDYLTICRLCMCEKSLTEIFGNQNWNLPDKIYSCLGLRVLMNDSVTLLICTTCIERINNFYSFKEQCLQVDCNLKKLKSLSLRAISDQDLTYTNAFHKLDAVHDKSASQIEVNKSFLTNELPIKINDSLHVTEKQNQKKNCKKQQNVYQCDKCGQIYTQKRLLVGHLQSHAGIKPFICTICSKGFTRAEQQKIHYRSHMGIKPFICEICGSTSTKKQDLMRHMRIHSEEKKYKCRVCDRSFKRSGDVHRHMLVHTHEKPYTCNKCEKAYSSWSSLIKHGKTHHNSWVIK